eukprot:s163_g26.t1
MMTVKVVTVVMMVAMPMFSEGDALMGLVILTRVTAVVAAAAVVVLAAVDAPIIGFMGALFALATNDLIHGFRNEKRLKIDDPVGAVGVHGSAAIWGVLAVGLFADGKLLGVEVENGLFRGGGFNLLGVQLLSLVAILGWAVITVTPGPVTPFFMVVGAFLGGGLRNWHVGLRVATEVEVGGLDQALHGVTPKRGLALGAWHARQISEAGLFFKGI